MTDRHEDDMDPQLEHFFQAARSSSPQVPQDLMARVLADATAQQPGPPRVGWRGWIQALGGAPGLGGLVTAACVGLWIGIAPPQQLPDLGGLVLGVETYSAAENDLFGWDIEEG